MGFHVFRRKNRLTASQRMIREHAHWLSRALCRSHAYPRIPTRRVSEGGFARLMTTPTGRAIASRWWEDALGNDG